MRGWSMREESAPAHQAWCWRALGFSERGCQGRQWPGASGRLTLTGCFPRGSVEPLTVLDALWFRHNWFASERSESSVSP